MAARAGKLTGGLAGKWRWRGGSRVAGAFASADRAARDAIHILAAATANAKKRRLASVVAV